MLKAGRYQPQKIQSSHLNVRQSYSKIKKATLIAVALGVFSHRVFTNTSQSRRDARRRLHTAKAGVVLESPVGHLLADSNHDKIIVFLLVFRNDLPC